METIEDTNKNGAAVSGYLKWSVFITGAGVMAAEMAAPRLLAPAFGASQPVWTNIIGVILTALTLGALAGGRLADRWPTERAYAVVLAASGASLAVVPFAAAPFLGWAAGALPEVRAGLFLLSLFAVTFFFAPPVFLMGMLGPWAVRIAGAGRGDLGSVAGTLSALSALGSIAGTFLTPLVFIPLFGTRATLLSAALLVAATGVWKLLDSFLNPGGQGGPRDYKTALFDAFLIVCLSAAAAAPLLLKDAFGPVKLTPGQLFEAESEYQYVEVVKTRAGDKHLLLNEGLVQHSVLPSRGFLTGGYWDHVSALPSITTGPGDQLKVLILGLAGGTMARALDRYYGATRKLAIDGVEIDPAVIDAGNRFFGLKNIPTLTVHVADARLLINTDRSAYDMIVADAFRQPYIPFHLATGEFYRACLARLSDRGVFVVNLGVNKGDKNLTAAFAATLRSAFPFVHCFTVENDAYIDNIIYVGSRRDISPETGDGSVESELKKPLAQIIATWREPEAPAGSFVFTDDRAPVEFFTERMAVEGALAFQNAIEREVKNRMK